jgi:hypothetical protein
LERFYDVWNRIYAENAPKILKKIRKKHENENGYRFYSVFTMFGIESMQKMRQKY